MSKKRGSGDRTTMITVAMIVANATVMRTIAKTRQASPETRRMLRRKASTTPRDSRITAGTVTLQNVRSTRPGMMNRINPPATPTAAMMPTASRSTAGARLAGIFADSEIDLAVADVLDHDHEGTLEPERAKDRHTRGNREQRPLSRGVDCSLDE